MNLRRNGFLALVAAALGGFVYFYEIQGEVERRAEIEESSKVHSGFLATAVDAVELRSLDGAEARFERSGGEWRIVRPVEGRADALALDAIASALADLPSAGRVGPVSDLSSFGLGAGTEAVRFEVAGASYGLRIGRDTPVGGHRYVARLADDEVAFVDSYRVNAFRRNLDDLRDRRIFPFESGDVETLDLIWPGGDVGVSLEHGAAGDWRVVAPIQGAADGETVRDVLSDLIYLRASGFVDEPSEAERAALAETAMEFRWSVSGGQEEHAARIAGAVGEDRLLEAPGGRLYRIPGERLDDFPRTLFAYRFKRLADFELVSARRLEFEFPAQGSVREAPMTVVAELEDSGWVSPGRPLDPDRASDLVRRLSNLEADGLFAEEMGERELASLGLSPPLAQLRILGGRRSAAKAEVLADLAFGRLDSDRGLFVQRARDPAVYLLAPEQVERLPISASAYRAELEVSAVELEEAGPGPAL